MASRSFSRSTAAALVLCWLARNCHSFAPRSLTHHERNSFSRIASYRSIASGDLEAETLMQMKESISLTPEGTGFSSPISRIVKLARRGDGYCRSNGSDRVIDVMEAITKGAEDSALVFDDDTQALLGIFTEADYIRVRTCMHPLLTHQCSRIQCFTCPNSHASKHTTTSSPLNVPRKQPRSKSRPVSYFSPSGTLSRLQPTSFPSLSMTLPVRPLQP